MTIRIIKHESIPQTGSYEVRFSDGRPSVYHYFDDDPGAFVWSILLRAFRAEESR
jgi:hypothetical protein